MCPLINGQVCLRTKPPNNWILILLIREVRLSRRECCHSHRCCGKEMQAWVKTFGSSKRSCYQQLLSLSAHFRRTLENSSNIYCDLELYVGAPVGDNKLTSRNYRSYWIILNLHKSGRLTSPRRTHPWDPQLWRTNTATLVNNISPLRMKVLG